MTADFILLATLIPLALSQGQERVLSRWGWSCDRIAEEDRCVRHLKDESNLLVSLNTCKLTCGPFGQLWPRPQEATIGKDVARFCWRNIRISQKCQGNICSMLEKATTMFVNNIKKLKPDDHCSSERLVTVNINVNAVEDRLTLQTNESYGLNVRTSDQVTTADIVAPTYFGARHALETLSQLVDYSDEQNSLQIVQSAEIKDEPAFPYRGLLLDTSRNFYSVDDIKRTIDAMSWNKLNTFHWHITDSHSFPLYLDAIPELVQFGAYSGSKVYYPENVQELVEYARLRGVRVLPEFDAPSHVGNGFQFGKEKGLGDLAVCVNQEPWQSYCVEPPCGQFNIANENIYEVLSTIYKEMLKLFGPIDLFHYGGDEVNLNCWNTTSEITNWMIEKGNSLSSSSYYKEWGFFQENAKNLLTIANNGSKVPGIIWTSELTTGDNLNQYLNRDEYIIQIWTDKNSRQVEELLRKNYKVIFSNYDSWYFDCGFGAWVGAGNNWCSPYKGWQEVYDNSPHDISERLTGSRSTSIILGGEAAIWSEQADGHNTEAKLWPRGAALAERLWTNPSTSWKAAEYRMIQTRDRLVRRGVRAERLQPEWCRQNEGLCYL